MASWSEAGKADAERAAAPHGAGDPQPGPMAPEDAKHGGKTQAASGRLGGEEWIEDPRQHVGGHAHAGVFHLQQDEGTRLQCFTPVVRLEFTLTRDSAVEVEMWIMPS